MIRYYSVDGAVKFQIKNSASALKQYFDTTEIQFANFLSEKNIQQDLTVELGPFVREDRPHTILDDTYYIAEDYIYFKDKRKLSKWEVEISDIGKSPKARIATNLVGNINAPLNIIEFLIQYSLLKKQISIIHASGVGKDGKCVIFPARSGGGKTTVALSLLDRGFSYLGDNYIILDKTVAKSYISPLNIFTYNLLPIVEKNLSSRQRLSMFLKKNFYTLTGGYFKIFEKINPASLFGDLIVNDLPISLICLLEVTNKSIRNDFHVKEISKEVLIKKLRYNMELDLLSFSKYIYSYGYMFPQSTLSKFWQLYEQVLKRNLPDDITAFSIEAPLRWTPDRIGEIVELIERKL